MIRVRSAQPNDATAIVALERDAFDFPWDTPQIAPDLGQHESLVMVAEAGTASEIVGYALFRRVLDEAELLRLAVSSKQRRQGVGRALLGEALRRLQGLGTRVAHLEVRRDNLPAIAFYERAGWHRAGLRRRYYRDGMDALLYHIEL